MKPQNMHLSSNEYCFKIVDMLQQNWALIDSDEHKAGGTIYFIDDNSGVFDQLQLADIREAERQLRVNGFTRFEEDEEAKKFIIPPTPPFHRSSHPDGAIYSSGRFWVSK